MSYTRENLRGLEHFYFLLDLPVLATKTTAGGTVDTVTTEIQNACTAKNLEFSKQVNSYGIVASGTENKCQVLDQNGHCIFDQNGNIVYARLTESGSTYSLTYYSLVANIETTFAIPKGQNIEISFRYRHRFTDIQEQSIYDAILKKRIVQNRECMIIPLVKDALNEGIETDVFADRNLIPILMPDFSGKITRVITWFKTTFTSTTKPLLNYELAGNAGTLKTTDLEILVDNVFYEFEPDGNEFFTPRQQLKMTSQGGGNLDATEGVVYVYYEEVVA